MIVAAHAPATPPHDVFVGFGDTKSEVASTCAQALLAAGIDPPGGSQSSRNTTRPRPPSSGPKRTKRDVRALAPSPDPASTTTAATSATTRTDADSTKGRRMRKRLSRPGASDRDRHSLANPEGTAGDHVLNNFTELVTASAGFDVAKGSVRGVTGGTRTHVLLDHNQGLPPAELRPPRYVGRIPRAETTLTRAPGSPRLGGSCYD